MYPFKLMSFNIGGYSTNCEAVRHWNNRAPICVDILRRYDADLIGFQEMQAQNRSTLEEHLTKYAYEYGVKTINRAEAEANYNPIWWKPELFMKIDAGSFYLSRTPDRWSKSWDAAHVRSATWVRLLCLGANVPFIYINVHMDHRGRQARLESSRLIVRRLMQIRHADNSPIVISGDFNARAWSPANEAVNTYPSPILPDYLPIGNEEYRTFSDQGYKDTYLEAGYGNQLNMNSYHGYYGGVFPHTAMRIDWIMILQGEPQLRTNYYQLIDDALPPVYASDHYPIMVGLGWS